MGMRSLADTRPQIQLHTIKRNYHVRLGDRITLRTQALLPLYQIINLPDEILSGTTARVGALAFPEKDAQSAFEVVTKYNAVVPQEIADQYNDLRQGTRPQMTWKLLVEQIRLSESKTHLMYLSGLLMKLKLVQLWQAESLNCMPCTACGNVVFANTLVAACPACPAGAVLELRPNPQIIARIADETAALSEDHGLLVADRVWEKLLGGPPVAVDDAWLRKRERWLSYARLTWVFMWMGRWGGGRLVLVDVLE